VAISRLSISNPSANTDTLLYTRTGSRVALASVIATNKSAVAATIRVWVVPELQDAIPANHVTIAYDVPVAGNNSLETFRFALEPEDKVYIRVTSADMSISITGIDNTNVSGTEFATLQAAAAAAQLQADKALVYALVGL
jgi:SpoU rRNA methylase family enzyme